MIVSTRTSIQMVINTVVDLNNGCSTVNYIGMKKGGRLKFRTAT